MTNAPVISISMPHNININNLIILCSIVSLVDMCAAVHVYSAAKVETMDALLAAQSVAEVIYK